ncbi:MULTISPECIES: GtrA family protein [unclassified Dysgonomonas]|uniref:GtrA family protein n=1 Tax=unclassified Dysgonomonas TaxID=2630389 RepID=UPI002472E986|nr:MULTISPECIES: GtrA family protein [unclassified Dysgonomonas]
MGQTFKELIKYGIVGVIGVVIDAGVYYLLVDMFAVHYSFSGAISSFFESLGGRANVDTADALVSSIVSSSLGAINNFIWNSFFTFKVHDKILKRFVPYALMVLMGMCISTLLLTFMLDYLMLNAMLAKIIAIVIVAMIQFVLSKLVIFKKKQEKVD